MTPGRGMRPRRGGLAIAALLLGLALAAAPPLAGRGLAAGRDGPDALGLLWLPEGAPPAAPMPVVVAVHDATGIDPRGWRYAEQLTAAGIAVLHLELQDGSGEDAPPLAAPGDGLAALARLAVALDILAEDPRFEGAPLGLLAFGAAGPAAALAAAEPGLGARIAGLALLYPGCDAVGDALAAAGSGPRAPVLLLHGDADPANPPADCMALAARLARTAPVRRVQYAGAGYAWDLVPFGVEEVPKLPWPGRPGWRVAVRYWQEGAALSATQAAGFFARVLAARRR